MRAEKVRDLAAESRRTLSGEDLALLVDRLDALGRDRVRGEPQVALSLAGLLADLAVGALHRHLEPRVDLFLAPRLRALVLDPLVVAHRHAAGVREHVRQDVDALLEGDALARRVARAVGPLGDELHVERLRLGLADLVLERAGGEDVGLGREELLAGDGLTGRVARDADAAL